MKTTRLRRHAGKLALVAAALLGTQAIAAEQGPSLLQTKCMGCHLPEGNDSYSRISHQRKTPEGWLMSIGRMQVMHGLQISDDDRRTLVKYLADKQGLAPSETDGVRYAMERRLNTVEHFDDRLSRMCGRCHSGARVALQRRPAQEWEHLVNFHLGQWPSLEYQAQARDRDWLDIALKQMVPDLAKRFPLDNPAWSAWEQAKPNAEALSGQWSFAGHMLAKGDVRGVMSVTAAESDTFRVEVKGIYADGTPFNGSGSAILYNGYEWRGNVKVGEVNLRQVFAALDGEMKGRMYEAEHDERGLDFTAVKEGKARLLAVQPGFIKAGSESEISLVGSGLSGKPALGEGIEIIEVLESSPSLVRVKVRAARDAAPGTREVALGSDRGLTLAVYDKVDEVKVVPAFSIARIGENGGSTPKVQGRFEAEAWGKDASGQPLRIGYLPATWKVEPFNERAIEDEDVKFAGSMQADGVFMPAGAGPNPERKMMTNNAGNLKVIAQLKDGGQQGEGHLIVTVQRWNNPPLP
ncbi:Quinohemoprotein amine dehydrogenase subunit alpha PeaA [Pseudomonas reidholzensis]|uniref:Quinohemoprotein amine dehydrogenase subunit alpha PeaA n=1 Tax=Pseudomonas reidholzensis TaxID=1785162 RepID=A0A383RZ20_9PSED|nr:quinohemoprotein amine dehydrogenase subunit alpha [Pseudomonas reidholzensis]SYX92360.1 Quinohemoprotein amine dehydrogenase subunit alpha PeaA [Pseudomonas reidholzensis]